MSVGGDGETRVWNIGPTGPEGIGAIDLGRELPAHLTISPDGSQAAVSSDVGGFMLIDLPSGEIVEHLVDQTIDWFTPAPVSPDWGSFAWLDGDGAGWLGELSGDRVLAGLPPCTLPKAFDPTGSMLLLDGIGEGVGADVCDPADPPDGGEFRSRVLDLDSGEDVLDLGERPVFGRGGHFNPGGAFEPGRYVAVNIDAGVIEIHEVPSGRLVTTLDLQAELPLDMTFDPEGRFLAVGTQHGRTLVYDFAQLVDGTRKEDAAVFDVVADAGGVPGVALSADGILATAAFGSLRLWDIGTGALLVHLPVEIGPPPFAAFSPNGADLYHFDEGFVLRRFPLDTGRLIELAESLVTWADAGRVPPLPRPGGMRVDAGAPTRPGTGSEGQRSGTRRRLDHG